ncbi:recombinase family protein [Nocardioides campestrisoli]|uniref:recombinase family protein n=1 Tax=Nocardioides campestrisoli TaxID=2736757 RepID=UPI00163DD800|nr:recombinase family protein [Nocardioides campestrisoli]
MSAPLDPWADYDAATGRNEPLTPDLAPRRFAFYGRVSTEDNQDPETSRQWQLKEARDLLALHCPGAEIVAEYFDIGFSRSFVWGQRPRAQRLLDDMDDRDRGWEAVVVGEGKRCFYGAQFSDVAPMLVECAIPLYIKDLGGRYDPANTMHDTLMALAGGMSAGERETTRVRVSASMEVQTVNEGRYQGGRPPYGYTAEAFRLHPHPGKAADGIMQKRLVIDPVAAPVVRRVFEETLDGRSLRQIMTGLNGDGIPCPSKHDAKRNSHRSQDGWQVSTIAAILSNARYTGFEQWGKFKKAERLVDPKNPPLGKKQYLKRNDRPAARSLRPAHAPIVSVEEFTHVQALRAAKSAGGMKGQAKQTRDRRGPIQYALRGMIHCGDCGRRMQPSRYNTKNDHPTLPRYVKYRCRSRDLVEGSPAMATHPANVSVGQTEILDEVLRWIASLFAPAGRAAMLDDLMGWAEKPTKVDVRRATSERKLAEVEKGLANLVSAIEAGTDPALLAGRISELTAEKKALVDVLALTPATEVSVTREMVETYLDSFVAVATELDPTDVSPELLHAFFETVRLRIDFEPETRMASAHVVLGGGAPEKSEPHAGAVVAPGGVSVRVRGGT